MADERLRQAERLAFDGDLAKAFELLNGAERGPEEACLYVSVCRMLGKREAAGRELSGLLSRFPDHPRANHLRAMELLDSGDLPQAEARLKKAENGYRKEQTGELSELFTDWGSLHFERGDTIRAVLAWRRALKLSPDNEAARKNLDQFEDVRFEQAETINEMIRIARHPSQVLAHLMRSQDFKTPREAEDFAAYVLSLWNSTPRDELGGKTPAG